MAIDLRRLHRCGACDPAQPCRQQGCDQIGADDGLQRGLDHSAAIAQEDDVRGELVEQALQIAGFNCTSERQQRCAVLGLGNRRPRAPRGDMVADPVCDLPDRDRGVDAVRKLKASDGGNINVVGSGDLAQTLLGSRSSCRPMSTVYGRLMLHRCLARDCETHPARSGAVIRLAMTGLVACRLSGDSSTSWRDAARSDR
ncbi:hypothetical protein [Streptomyces sp. Ru72]|uniref:hypothetical protein n=1 Tax=Streptomyces sp. Ru72 TaxID=2080747 RepID=UPI0021561E1A|nr:hypothetical protein [Streptomyces sp. Ru72]